MPWKPGNPGEECCEGCTLFNGVPTESDWTFSEGVEAGPTLSAGDSITYNDTVSNTQISTTVYFSEVTEPFIVKLSIGSTWAKLEWSGTVYTLTLSAGGSKSGTVADQSTFVLTLGISDNCVIAQTSLATIQQFLTSAPTGNDIVFEVISGEVSSSLIQIRNHGTSVYGYHSCSELGCTPPCCPEEIVPDTLYVTLSNELNCSCATGVVVTLTWNPLTEKWEGTTTACGPAMDIEFWCNLNVWQIKIIGCIKSSSDAADPLLSTCDPFEQHFDMIVSRDDDGFSNCCNNALNGAIMGFTVTE